MAKPSKYKGARGTALLQATAQTASTAEETASQAPSWTEVTDKPSEFPPEAHEHPMSDLENTPIEIVGARDDPEGALLDLLTKLAAEGLITDSTTAT